MRTQNSNRLLHCTSGYIAIISAHEKTGTLKKARNRAWANSQKRSPAVEFEEMFSAKPKRVT